MMALAQEDLAPPRWARTKKRTRCSFPPQSLVAKMHKISISD